MTQREDGSGSRPSWVIHLTGDVGVSRARPDGPAMTATVAGQQAAMVLAILAVERREVHRDELAELLWGETAALPPHWPNAVRIVVSKVRALLVSLGAEHDAVSSVAGRVSMHLPGGWATDLELATAALDEAEHLARADPRAAADLAGSATASLGSSVLMGATTPLAIRLAHQAAALLTRGRHLSIRADLASNDAAAAAATARTCIEADPLDEVAHDLLIRALLAADLPAAAWRAYSHLARTLSDELGVAPSPSTRALVSRQVHASRRSRQPGVAGTAHAPVQFLGRRDSLAQFRALWDVVVDEHTPALAVVEGVTGIGKTRLVREFSDELQRSGAQVLWGTAHADSGLPYEPVVDALRRRLRGPARRDEDPVPGDALAGLLGLGHGPGATLPPSSELPMLDTASAIRSAVLADLQRVVEGLVLHPTVWVVDDAQWASSDTLAFLHLVLQSLEVPVLLIVLKRTGAAHLATAIAQWLHEVPSATLTLGRLSASDLQPLVAELSGLREELEASQLQERLLAQTGGHPYLLVEVARGVRGGADLTDDAPASARSWIRHRVAALPRDVASVLGLAAVIGEKVPVSLLQRCASVPVDAVVGAVEMLISEGFLGNSDDPDLVVFPHQITQSAVASLIIPARLSGLHLRVADALVATVPTDPGAVARHLFQAGPDHAGRAMSYAVEAAERNLAVGDWGSARDQLQHVHEQSAEPPVLAAAAVALGIAEHQLGSLEAASASLFEAVEIARRHRCAPELASAVLSMVGRGGRGAVAGMSDEQRIELLREALTALEQMPQSSERDTDDLRELLAVRVEGELGWATLFTATVADRTRLATGGLRRIADRPDVSPMLQAQSLLNVRSVRVEGQDVRRRLAECDRVLDLPRHHLTPDIVLSAMISRQEDLLCSGDLAAARTALDEAERAADRWSSPHWQWAAATWRALHAAIDGDVAAAERLLREATSRAGGPSPEVSACEDVQLICLRLLDGRAREVLELTVAAADANPHIPCYRAVSALVAVESGEHAIAEDALDRCAEAGFATIPRDSNRMLALAVLGDVVADLGRFDLGADLLDRLEPWAGQQIVLNCYAGGGAYWGPVDRVLGRLARLLGDARAQSWLESAHRSAAQLGCGWASARLQRDAHRDSARSASLR